MAEYKVTLGVDFTGQSVLDNAKNQINSLTNTTHNIRIQVDTSNITTQINNIRTQLQNLNNIQINIGGNGGRGARQANQVTEAYREMMSVIRQMGSVQSKLQLLDTRKDVVQIRELGNQLETLRARYYSLQDSYEHAFNPQQVTNLLNALDQMDNKVHASMAKMSDNTFARQQADAYKELLSVAKQMGNIELKIGGLKSSGGNPNQIAELESQYRALQATYQQLNATMSVPLSHNQMQGILTQIGETHNKLALLDAKIADTKQKLAGDIATKFGQGDFGKIVGNDVITNLDASFNKLRNKTTEVTAGINEVKNAIRDMDIAIKSGDVDGLVSAHGRYQAALKKTSNEITILTNKEREMANAEKLAQQATNLSLNMDNWLKNNSAAASQFGARIQQLQAELQNCDSVRFTGIKGEFEQIKQEAALAGVNIQTFGDRLKTQMSKLGVYMSGMMMITQAMRALRSMADNTLKVDTAMTELYRVTDLSSSQYSALYDDMVNSAKEYGTTLDSIINSTASWVRLGFDPTDANRLAEITSMYQHVTDLDESTAVNNLVTAYKGFQDQLLELNNNDKTAAVEMVADIYDALGNQFAEGAADVGEGLSKSASVLAQGGASIQEAAGMFTGIQEVIQDSSSAGTALKIMTLRIRGMKGELEELGEDVNDDVDSMSKMQTQILNLTHGKVNIFDDNGNFRNIYDIMKEIAAIYDDLTDTEQAALLEDIAGKNRANAVQAMLKNWESVEKATEAAYNSGGTAAKEQGIYMESLQGHLDQLAASWQSLSADFLSSDFLKGCVDGLKLIVELLDKMVSTFGTLGTIGLTNGVIQLFKNGGYFKTLASTLAESTTSMSNFGAAASMALGDLKSFMLTPTGIATGIGLATAAIGVAVQQYQKYRQQLRQDAQKSLEEANSQMESMDAFEEAYVVASNYADRTNLTAEENAKLQSAIEGVTGALGDQAGGFDTANGSAQSYLETLQGITQEQLEKNLASANQGEKAARDLLSDTADPHWGGFSLNGSKITTQLNEQMTGIDTHVAALNIVNDLMADYIDMGTQCQELEPINFDSLKYGSQEYTDAISDYYYQLLKLRDALSLDDLAKESDIYDSVDKSINSLTNDVESYVDAKEKQLVAEYEYKNGIPKTIEEYQTMKKAILDSMDYSDNYENAIGSLMDTDFSTIFDLSQLNSQVDEAKKYSQEQIDSFAETLGASWDKVPEKVKTAYDNYQSVLKEMESKGINPSDAIFGNIDLNDRGVIQWTEENLKKYKDVLSEYAQQEFEWNNPNQKASKQYIDDYVNSFKDSISTVFGGSEAFEIGEKEVEIAFSPMLQTGNGNAELLSPSTVRDYINRIISESMTDGKWSTDELLQLDAAGLDVNGKHIQGLIADIGDTAIKTGESMHYLGKDGAAGTALQEFQSELKSANMTEQEFYDAISDNKVKEWFDGLSQEDKELAYEISVRSDDTTLWSLTKWKEELEAIKDTGQTTGEQMQQFYDIMNNTDDGGLPKNIENYTKNLKTLQDALSKINTGEYSKEDIVSLVTDFPSLAPFADDTDALSEAIQNLIDTSNQDINSVIDSFIESLGNNAPEAVAALEALRDAINGLTDNGGFNFDIDEEIAKFDNLYSAMKESVSGTGLSTKAMENVKSMFKDLDGYNPSKLFERTANGIHLNTNELRNLQAQYQKNKTKELNDELKTSIDRYNELGKSLSDASLSADGRAAAMQEMGKLKNHISEVADLAAQYEGLTSAYNRWIQAQSSGEEGDMYDSMRSGLEDAKKMYEEGLIGTNAFRSYVDLLSGEDLSTANAEQVQAAWQKLGKTIEGTSYKATDFLADGSDGVLNFLKATEQLDSDLAKMNSDGSWDINFGVGKDQEIADKLGVDVEFVQSMMRKLSDYGFDVNLDSIYTGLENLGIYAEEANEKLKELGKTDVDFNFDTTDISEVDSQITEAQTLLDTFKNTDGTVNTSLEGATEAEAVLIALITRKQELNAPAIMSVDTTTADANISTTIGLLQDFQTNYNDIEIETAVGADTTEAQTNIQTVASSIESLPDEVKTTLGLDDADFQAALTTITSTEVDVKAGVSIDTTALDTVQSKIAGISPEMIATLSVNSAAADEYTAPDKDAKVTYDVNDAKVQGYKAPEKTGTVTYSAQMNSWTPPTKYGTVVYTAKNGSPSNGTANSLGIGLSKGTAFAKGNWGTTSSGVALGGEVGQELVVRDGHFFTIGDEGAEFFEYKKDDIIFNAGQTAQIFKYGKIKNGKKRGDVFAQGNAFVEGTAFSNATGTLYQKGKVKTTTNKSTTTKKKSSTKKTKDSKKDKDPDYFDWIELAIDRVERAIERLDRKANSTFKSWKTRNSALTDEISKVTQEINTQSKGYDRYIKQANSVGLSSSLAKKVRDGSIDITKYDADSETYKKIKLYQEWYEKALDCKDAIDELKEKEAELYKQRFDNVATKYDEQLQVFDFRKSMINEKISQQEAQGHLISKEYYSALKSQEQDNIKKLTSERDDLIAARDEAIKSGTIAYGSEAWYEMSNQIDQVTLSIEEANTAILEYNKSMREADWKVFDLIQDRISKITQESDFLIKLMEDEKLYDDNGQLTKQGQATMGLHAVNYDTYMEQADKYAAEIKKINQEIAKDPYNEDLIERKQELIELQQESILAANEEKQAIKDMVSEGIEKELDALQKLIDKYKESLSSQKDLYDYQKKVKDQTKEIASIQKQLSAYEGDTSEETKAKVQKLKVSLEESKENLKETEYDQYISDTEKMLDNLYDEYELILNTRLDNIDKLLSDMIDATNANANTIKTTLETETKAVGITMSDEMKAIWNTGGGANTVVATYGNGISGSLTTIGTVISGISTKVQAMATKLGAEAKEETKVPTATTTTTKKAATTATTTTTKKATTTTKKTTTTTKKKTYSDKQKWGVALAIWNGNQGWGTGSTRKQRLQAKGFNYSEIQGIVNKGYNAVLSGAKSRGASDYTKYGYNKFAVGARKINKNQIAWTQEEGTEFIVRPSDGAILTPVAKGDSVLTANASGNIWNMANNPSDFIRDNLKLGKTSGTPSTQNIGGNTFSGNISLELILPNVKNYEEFKYAMQHDKNFENMVKAMTVDKIFGESSLKKYKY